MDWKTGARESETAVLVARRTSNNKKGPSEEDGPQVAWVPGNGVALPHHARSAPTRRAVAMMRMMVGGAAVVHGMWRVAERDKGVKCGNP